MLWRFICLFAVAATLWLWPLELSAYVAPITGCHHNGSWYADKSLVPTMEKCLNCQCNKKTLVCRLKVCPEMPMPPPRGCVVVQKKHTCCPYLSCARLEAFYKIPMTRRIIQYLDHYERESIDRVVNDNMLQRRSDDSDTELHVCVKNGTVYKSGSAMSSSNLCSYCYCIGGAEKCVKPKCMLPVDGCKPIFVDSTCCPVRYDCSAKASGKSSQEVRYRKTSNKHFLRMSQRLQRNRGCNAGNQFYSEGQKMKSDSDKPCDICFCIRGQRRCAPKKCSPALKNCIPVVPKGQCCPSSYDCGSQRDYRRSHNSRQFNLFSFLFDKDGNEADGDDDASATEMPEQFIHDREPLKDDNPTVLESNIKPTSEKSIFDTIREGLEFIDGNNDKLLEENIDLLPPNDPLRTAVSLPPPTSTSTEVSFLDLLLGPDTYKRDPAKEETSITEEKPTTTGAYNDLSWVDLLIGEEEADKKRLETTYSNKFDSSETTTEQGDYGTTNVDRVSDDFDDFSGDGDSLLTDESENVSIENLQSSSIIESTTLPSTTTSTTKLYRKPPKPFFHPISQKTPQTQILNDWKSKPVTKVTDPVTSTTHPSVVAPQKPTEQLHKSNTTVSQSMFTKNVTKLNHADQVNNQNNKNSILSAFFDGISSVLESKTENVISSSTISATTTTTTLPTTKSTTIKSTTSRTTTPKATQHPITLPTPKPLPQFKPLPTIKSHTRINSKLANLTTNPPMMTVKLSDNTTNLKPLPHSALIKLSMKNDTKSTTPKPTTTTLAPKASANTTRKPIETTTLPPLVISTNPTILEADPIDNVGELPPSLPNLEIIPFLPTDAVKTDRNLTPVPSLSGEYYNSPQQTSRIDFESFNEDSIYPTITERYPTFGDEHDDDSKVEYNYKINVEGPVIAPAVVTPASFPAIKYGIVSDVTEVELEVGMPAKQGFSPPTKTEGGFVPKESFIIGADGELHEQMGSIIDITSAQPLSENTTNIIEFTTPDPFKDVIRTEPPPDLTVDRKEDDNKFVAPLVKDNKLTYTNETQVEEVNRRQTISSLLDLLYKYNDKHASNNKSSTNMSTSTVPPFKLLPDETHKYITTITTINAEATKIPSTTPQPTSQPASVKPQNKNTTTTKRPLASKTPSKHRAKPSRPANVTSTTSSMTTTAIANTSLAELTKSKINNSTKVTGTRTSAKKPIVYKTTTTAPISSTTTASPTTTTSSIKSSTVNPFLMSPFDKLPFMAASYNVRHPIAALGSPTPNAVNIPQNEVQNHYLDYLEYKNSLNKYEGLESIYDNDYTPTPSTTTTPAAPQAQFFHHSQQQHTTATNNIIDPMGMLKLDACNIYGRMYHVGRIILELSSACLECKCTEVGVKCDPWTVS